MILKTIQNRDASFSFYNIKKIIVGKKNFHFIKFLFVILFVGDLSFQILSFYL